MKEKDQFEREKKSQTSLDARYVILASDFQSSPEFATAVQHVQEHDLANYPRGIIMPAGDRNLLSIFQSERPSTAEIGVLMKQVTEAVDHLHEKNLMHGDIKMNNVVRQNNRLRMIDFDAAADLGDDKSLAGSKFSSGVLPPEVSFTIFTQVFATFPLTSPPDVRAAQQHRAGRPHRVLGQRGLRAAQEGRR